MLSDKQLNQLEQAEILGSEMADLKSHVAYKKILEIVNDRMEYIDGRILDSIDPNEVFACTKEKNGILFFIREVNQKIEEGIRARTLLLKNTP